MRLPPPPRRYSPISVMATASDTVSRPNSRSMAARSSRTRSKISRTWVVTGVVKTRSWSLRPVIDELHVDAKIAPAQQCDDLLQYVAVFAAHAHQVALDRGLHFFLAVLDVLHD